ncbi:hypothetical protein MUO79_10585 [Candidatus Bathyarchaeota archaeon]|nr:hypothetical protein [Candidatus Bathyarchaeota archaeon]
METPATGRSKRQTSYEFYKKLFKLTIGGGVVFWAITIAGSLLPIAAEYRAAFSISNIQTVWVGSLLAGMIIGCCVSYFLLRFFDKIPTKHPILKAVILSFVPYVMVLILLGVATSLLEGDGLYVFLIGATLNVPRFLFLGIVIGYLYKRLYGSA